MKKLTLEEANEELKPFNMRFLASTNFKGEIFAYTLEINNQCAMTPDGYDCKSVKPADLNIEIIEG